MENMSDLGKALRRNYQRDWRARQKIAKGAPEWQDRDRKHWNNKGQRLVDRLVSAGHRNLADRIMTASADDLDGLILQAMNLLGGA